MSRTVSDTYLFEDYSKKKLQCLSKTYGEIADLYQNMQEEASGYDSDGRKDYLHNQQIVESKLVFAKQLREISGAVGEVADTVIHVSSPAEHKKKALIQYLKRQGIIVSEIVYLEQEDKRRLSMIARQGGKAFFQVEDIAGMLSVFFDRRIIACLESDKQLKKTFSHFMFEDEPKYTIMSAMSRAIKENEKVSGDNYSVEEQSNGNIVMMIADGMGSGSKACKDSQAVIEFMEKFLEAGFHYKKAISMINSAIASGSHGGNLTTLDFCILDLHTGEAEMLKAGAASSFRKRGRMVDEISSDSLPLGSFQDANWMTQTVSLMDGDMIVMLSDGVTDCFDIETLKEIISKYETHNPKDMSDYLLTYAINCGRGRIRDDMTVLVAGVWQNY